jgi:hypothetical protein
MGVPGDGKGDWSDAKRGADMGCFCAGAGGKGGRQVHGAHRLFRT